MYDVIHFEALGKEAYYLEKYSKQFIKDGLLPENFEYLIVNKTLQEFVEESTIELPDLISIKTHSIIPKSYYSGNKKSLITRSAGYDHCENLDMIMNITSLREYCVDAVAQTAIKFVYQTCGFYNEYAIATSTFERNNVISFWELNKDKVAVVFGVGKIGKRIYDLLKLNGLEVLAVDIRSEELKELDEYKDVKFTDKETAMKESKIIINAMNYTKDSTSKFYNHGYFKRADFLGTTKKIFINVTRGEIAPEKMLLDLYEEELLLVGIALDVFSNELETANYFKGMENSENKNVLASKIIVEKALNKTANFYVQPHQAFNSDIAAEKKALEALNHVAYWMQNKRFKEQLPYYK